MVERLVYTELVGGSNPSPRTIFRLHEAPTEETASNSMPTMSTPGQIMPPSLRTQSLRSPNVSGIHAPVAMNLILPGHLQRQDR